VLPILDPDDTVMNDSFYHLGLAVESGQKLQTRIGDGPTDEEISERMRERTGRSVFEWEELVIQLRGQEGSWDWSKIEVAVPKPHEEGAEESLQLPEGVHASPAAYAVLTEEPDPYVEDAEEPPVFRQHDIVGPLGGMVQRRARYEEAHYTGHTKSLHDAFAYDFKLKAVTPELKLEPLVLDLVASDASNRLRYLSDARWDPLNLKPLVESAGAKGVFASQEMALPPRKYGDAMPRVRSRPSSPSQGDGGEKARAQQQELIDEAEAEVQAEEELQQLHEADEAQQCQDRMNVQIVEVLCQGWPYAFVVATKDIYDGERFAVDRGEEYWAKTRAAMARLKNVGRIGHDLVLGVDAKDEEEGGGVASAAAGAPQADSPAKEPVSKFRARVPMKRAQVRVTAAPPKS